MYSNAVREDPDEVEGDGDGEGGGWIEAAAGGGVTAEGFEELPSVARTEAVQVIGEEEDAAAQGAGDSEGEIPDISNLDLEEAAEVSLASSCSLLLAQRDSLAARIFRETLNVYSLTRDIFAVGSSGRGPTAADGTCGRGRRRRW